MVAADAVAERGAELVDAELDVGGAAGRLVRRLDRRPGSTSQRPTSSMTRPRPPTRERSPADSAAMTVWSALRSHHASPFHSRRSRSGSSRAWGRTSIARSRSRSETPAPRACLAERRRDPGADRHRRRPARRRNVAQLSNVCRQSPTPSVILIQHQPHRTGSHPAPAAGSRAHVHKRPAGHLSHVEPAL